MEKKRNKISVKFHFIAYEELLRKIKSYLILIPVTMFLIIPTIYILVVTGPFLQLFSDRIIGINGIIGSINFTYLIGIIGPLFALFEGVSYFSPQIKNGTIKILITKPLRRWEILIGKLCEFSITVFCCTFAFFLIQIALILFLSSGLISIFLMGSYFAFCYWIVEFLFVITIFSIMTFIDILSSSTIKSFMINLSVFILYPLVLVPMIVAYLETTILQTLLYTSSIITGVFDVIYFFCSLYYPYTILYHSLNYWLIHTDVMGLRSNFFRLIYPGSFSFSIWLLITILIVSIFLNILLISKKDFKD
ncbi:MAG: ABC transporter permease [Candidatus Helarchaeota archaeon]